jgi:hypothetical protein
LNSSNIVKQQAFIGSFLSFFLSLSLSPGSNVRQKSFGCLHQISFGAIGLQAAIQPPHQIDFQLFYNIITSMELKRGIRNSNFRRDLLSLESGTFFWFSPFCGISPPKALHLFIVCYYGFWSLFGFALSNCTL